jgi:uncharacterized membrane protein
MSALDEFISYFTNPTAIPVYTLPKTLAYAVVLIVAVLAIYEILKRLKIKIDRRLVIAIAPYIVFGGAARVLRDAGLTNSYWLVTPGIYMLVFAIIIVALGISLLLEKKLKIPYFKPMFVVGIVLASIPFMFLKFSNPLGAIYSLLFYLPWLVVFYFVRWISANKIVTLLQMFDATVTYVATGSGLVELHVLPIFLIYNISPISFIFVKLAAIVAFLLLIDRYANDKQFATYLKLIIGILGAATSTRDFIEVTSLATSLS